MTDSYFDKFPTINYNNTEIVDITKRVVLLDKVSKNPYLYYPYDISNGERPDQFAYRYYEDQYKDWILYLSNEIIDPYYEWYLQPNEFSGLLEKKYGSIETAYKKIIHYVNNWIDSDPISISNYNALTNIQKSYWEPNYNNNRIMNYVRKQNEWTINTNRIIGYTVGSNTFINNEIVNISFDGGEPQGQGQVLSVGNNTVYVQHTSGIMYPDNDTVLITANSYIYGEESSTNTVFTNVNAIANNFHPEEEVYWKAVSYYDYENERNEFNKTIRILDKKYAPVINRNLKNLLKD